MSLPTSKTRYDCDVVSAPAAEDDSSQPPQVSAIMPLADPRRARMAQVAVNNFMRQTYRNKRLIIANSSGSRVTNREHPWVEELCLDPAEFPTISSLRNEALGCAGGEWAATWDDDDHYHLHRLALQMAHRRSGACVALSCQLVVDVHRSLLGIKRDPRGLASTLLFPASSRYAEVGGEPCEDTELLQSFGARKVVLDNDDSWFPGMAMSVAFWHELNASSREAFFAGCDMRKGASNGVEGDFLDYVGIAVQQYGLQLELRPPLEDGELADGERDEGAPSRQEQEGEGVDTEPSWEGAALHLPAARDAQPKETLHGSLWQRLANCFPVRRRIG